MWTQDRSIRLSVACTIAMIALMLLTGITLPFALQTGIWIGGTVLRGDQGPLILPLYYCFCVPALVALVGTYRVLTNIKKDVVFDAANVRMLRMVSWAAIAGGIVCLAGTPISVVFLGAGLICGFVGVVVRVVKNLIAAAAELKAENDLTI